MPRIFISYRRQDSQDITGRIHDRLSSHFLGENVFMDTTHIPYGANFENYIKAEIEKSDVVLVMIGEVWASLKDEDNNVRIFNKNDYVKYEVETALSLESVEVMPVLVSGGSMPKASEIPPSLHSLTTINAPQVRSGADFNNDIANLISVIEQQFPDKNRGNGASKHQADSSTISSTDENKSYFTTFRVLISSLAAVILFVVAIATFGIDILSEDQMNDLRNFVGITTAIPPATEIPETRLADIALVEGNSTIERNALRVPLGNIASDPQSLVFVPSQFGSSIWGYSTADSRLFALDVATGQAHNLSDSGYFDVSSLDNALLTAMHYDGVWLWLGDSRNHRLIAIDPITLEIATEYDFGDSGEPTHLHQTADILWVTLRDRGEVLGLTLSHETNTVTNFCDTTIRVGESPYLVESQGNSAIWVVYGRGSETALRRIAVTGCILDDPIRLETVATGLTVSDDAVYLNLNGELAVIENDGVINDSSDLLPTINDIHKSNNGLWLVSETQLMSYNVSIGEIGLSITLNDTPRSLFVFGTQLWVVLENNQIVRYVIPDLTISNAVGLFETNERVIVITDDGLACPLDDTSPCLEVNIDGGIIAKITDDTLSNFLWLVDEANVLWRSNAITGESERITTLPVAPSVMELDAEGLLWLTDGISFLAVFDTETQQLINLLENGLSLAVPVSITNDGTTTWFAYQFPDRISSITYDGSVVRETPIDVDLNQLTMLSSDSQYLYGIEDGTLAIINSVTSDVEARYGIPSSLAQILVSDDVLYTLGNDGAIYVQPLDN